MLIDNLFDILSDFIPNVSKDKCYDNNPVFKLFAVFHFQEGKNPPPAQLRFFQL